MTTDRMVATGAPQPDADVLWSVLAASRTGTWRWDARSGEVAWDATLEALAGLAPGTFGGTYEAWVATLHPDERDVVIAAVEDAVARRGSYHVEHRVLRPDGEERWLECRGQVTTDADGEVTGTVGCAVDVTDRKVAEADREALLARAGLLTDHLDRLVRLGGLLAGAVTVEDVARIVVEHLDAPNTEPVRGLWVLDEDGTLVRVAGLGFADGDRFDRVAVDDQIPVAEAHRERRTIRSASAADAVERYPALAGVPRSTEGFVAVPITAGDTCLGVLVAGHSDPMDAQAVRFVEAVGGQLGQTMARVRLSEAIARRAQELAEVATAERRRREQLEFLAALTREALAAEDHIDLMQRVAEAAVPRLGDWCSVTFLPDGGAEVERALAHVDPEKVAWAEALRDRVPYDPDGPTGVPAVIRTGQSELVADIGEDLLEEVVRTSPLGEAETRDVLDRLALTSSLTVPLRTKQGVVGAMQFVSAESGRRYDGDDVSLAEAAAGRVAAALENMWLTDRHREIAVTLQRSLLPPELPRIEGMDVAARYWPAGEAYDVGGDFYDVFPIGPDAWAIVIGDVCGSGPDAAAVTAIARHTVRAAARHGHDHQEVLAWTNEAVGRSDRDLFCTACYATLERVPDGWRLRSAAAGHPLPVWCHTGGGTDAVGAHGTLLGVFDEVRTVTEEVLLRPGDAVTFYTDGISDLPGPYGITAEQVLEVIDGACASESADEVADAILASLTDRVPDASRLDDTALVVLRVPRG